MFGEACGEKDVFRTKKVLINRKLPLVLESAELVDPGNQNLLRLCKDFENFFIEFELLNQTKL